MVLHPDTAEEKLGFHVVRGRIQGNLISALGAEELTRARPSSDLGVVRRELGAVWELQQVLRFDDPLPLRHVLDVRDLLKRAVPEDAHLEGEELAALRLVLETIRLMHGFIQRRRDRLPILTERAEALTPLQHVEEEIAGAVDEQGIVLDNASEALRRIRASILKAQADLRSTLHRALRTAVGQGYATEEQPTIRGGRMVIPVRAEAKRKVSGFVHDTSASGQTVYIEPAACLDLNNEVRELESRERQEILRILRVTTARLRAHIPDIQRSLVFLGWFDYAHARARLANELGALVPHLNEEGTLDLQEGRNASLMIHFAEVDETAQPASGEAEGSEEREVVPLDLRLDDARRTLVITGPNAGGKTVAMKTVGLCTLMLGYGIPIPVDEKSSFYLFAKLFVDIGDEQSIEEDLSTFSSHVSNLTRMVREAGPDSLILIDEAGTGTDPEEGAALARAVLEALTDRGARTIATTHHGALKAFAHEADHVDNGSMAFDEQTLTPTYHFRPGIPGSSYAFPISRRQGLPQQVLERARELLGVQKASFEELITTFEARTNELARQIEALEAVRAEAQRERDRFQERLEKLQAERVDVRQQALQEAERIVAEANARVERTIREIRESQAARDETRTAREDLTQFSEEVRSRRERAERKSRRGVTGRPSAPEKEDAPAIRPGDRVVLDNGTTTAEVLEVEDGAATIVFGSTRLRTQLSRLTRVSGAAARKKERQKDRQEDRLEDDREEGRKKPAFSRGVGSGADALRSLQAQTSIDVRGKRAHEAVPEVVRLVDDAVAANLDQVEVLHGKGTGALRQAIREELERHPSVTGYEDAPWDQGGPGVTVVRL